MKRKNQWAVIERVGPRQLVKGSRWWVAASSHVAEICGVEMNEWIRLEIGVSKRNPFPLMVMDLCAWLCYVSLYLAVVLLCSLLQPSALYPIRTRGGVPLNNWVANRVGGVGCPQVNIWYKNLLMGPMLVCETGMESNELISSPSIFIQKTTCSLSQ